MEGADGPSVSIRLLGPVEAWRDGSPALLGGPRQRALLALLATNAGRTVSNDQLIDELWHGAPPQGAEGTLRSYVSRLRTAIGAATPIRSSPAGYALEIDDDGVDAIRFERLLREAEAALRRRSARAARARLGEALALWRGRPFGELTDMGALRAAADRLEDLRIRALELRIDSELALGAAAELVEELESLVRDHPYREAFWRQLMLALYRSERQAAALAAYHRARSALDEQLGIEPGEELVALEAAILRHEVPEVTTPAEVQSLPAPVTSFVGRETELELVEALVRENRLVTLTGVGGVGKTRLAIEASRRLAPTFADGVAFVDLAPLVDASLVTDQIVAALGVRGNPSPDPLDRLVEHLSGQEMLLVLDNCEHVLAASASVAGRLLGSCPSLRILATSRELLGIAGEADAPVPPLAIPVGDAAARDAEAVRLFVARARAARPGFAEDDATIAAIGRICADLDGIPLAIELAAARARVLSTAEIGDRLRDRFRFLVSWRRLTEARHRTLREAMDWSHDLLEPESQRLLAEVSVFAGGFTLEAVEQVCSIDESSSALDHVQRLVEASLVVVDQASEPTRYGLLETVREYGSERLQASGRSAEVHRRHAEHFATLAEAAWQPIRAWDTEAEWLDRLRADRENYRAGMGWSLDHGEPEIALRIVATLWRYWWVRGEPAEGRAWLERALAADTGDNPWLRARVSVGLAGIQWSLGDYEAAEVPAREARAIADDIGDHLIASNASNTLGLIASGRNDVAGALALFADSVEHLRVADLPADFRAWNLAIAIDNLGSTAYELADTGEARRRWLEARELNERFGVVEGVAMNDLHLSILDSEEGQPEAARDRLHSALLVYEAANFLHYLTECLESAAAVANGLEASAEAAFLLGAAAHIHVELNNQPVPIMARVRDRATATARTAVGDAAFETAYADGLQTPIPAALRRAIDFLAR